MTRPDVLAGVLASTFDNMTERLEQPSIELERANRNLEQMDRTKTRFIQVAAHELRTPLTIVQGYAQLIQVKAEQDEQFAKYSAGILEGTSRMVDIIDNMLDVSRIETRQLAVVPTEVGIDQVVEKVKSYFEAGLEQRKLTLSSRGWTPCLRSAGWIGTCCTSFFIMSS